LEGVRSQEAEARIKRSGAQEGAIALTTSKLQQSAPASVEKSAPEVVAPSVAELQDEEPEVAPEPEPVAAIEIQSDEETDYQPADSNLSQIWQQIIAHLHPLSKALLNEHGQLLSFDRQEARIGISSDKLVKIAQNQVKNIEKAFSEVFDQKVKVSLEVANPALFRANSAQSSPSPESVNGSTGNVDPSLKGAKEPANRKPVSNSSQARSPIAIAKNSPQSPSSPPAASSTVVQPEAKQEASRAEALQTNSWEEDEAARAAKQLAEFFGGKVVSDSGEVVETSELSAPELGKTEGAESTQWSNSIEAEESDDDVPF
jgi:DNA polymerase-3 subunit gamma/tau